MMVKKVQLNVEINDDDLGILEHFMQKKNVGEKEKSKFLVKLWMQGVNHKQAQEYTMRWVYSPIETNCNRCNQPIHRTDRMLMQGGVFICEDCFVEQHGALSARMRMAKKQLIEDLKCLNMDVDATIIRLDQLKAELKVGQEFKSFITNGRYKMLEIQKRWELKTRQMIMIAEEARVLCEAYQAKIDWNKFKDELPEIVDKVGTPEFQEYFLHMKALEMRVSNRVDAIITDQTRYLSGIQPYKVEAIEVSDSQKQTVSQ